MPPVASAWPWQARRSRPPRLQQRGLLSVDGAFGATATTLADAAFYIETYPTSPLILSPFKDPLVVPKALRPEPSAAFKAWAQPPGPGVGQQNSLGNQAAPAVAGADAVEHDVEQLPGPARLQDRGAGQHPRVHHLPGPADRQERPADRVVRRRRQHLRGGHAADLPRSTIYGFNGTFPGPMINAEYGRPALVRFINHLDENPDNLDRQDFGSPDYSFLTHLHNGHTAPESDGNPHYTMKYGPQHTGFRTGQWVDQMYLNWPAGGDDREKQSFFWFHDHRMDHTGSNVYKGMVGLYPIYDPKRMPGTTVAWTWATSGRACGSRACAPTTATAPSTSTTTSRWPSTTAGSTTG